MLPAAYRVVTGTIGKPCGKAAADTTIAGVSQGRSPAIPSEDGVAAQIFVPISTDADLKNTVNALLRVYQSAVGDQVTIQVTGPAGFAADLDIGGRLSQLTWDNGVIVRCFANGVIGFAPALCCSDDEMDLIFERVRRSLDQLLDQPDIRTAVS